MSIHRKPVVPMCVYPLMLAVVAGFATSGFAGQVEVRDGQAILTAGEYRAVFAAKPAWTLRQLDYRDQSLLIPTGAMQTVVNRKPPEGEKDPWVGTGHGKEIIEHVDVVVDGKVYPLTEGLVHQGDHFVLRKRSRLEPLRHWAVVELDANGLRQRFHYEVVEPAEHINFIYVFMHCMTNLTRPWMAQLADDKQVTGEFVDDASFTLRENIRWLAAYAPSLQLGLTIAYPEIYQSRLNRGNMLWNRARDNKHYLQIDPPREVGSQFGYAVELRGFQADHSDWNSQALKTLEPMLSRPVKPLEQPGF